MSMNSCVEVGVATPDETETLLQLMCEAFRMDIDAARPIFVSDPYLECRNRYVLRLEGAIVSCLTVVDRECWIGGAVVRVAGIAGVATRSSFRRRGFAGSLLMECLRALAGRGFHIAALFPADRGYYRKFGWETAGVQDLAHVRRGDAGWQSAPEQESVKLRKGAWKVEAAPGETAAYALVRRAGTTDLPEIAQIYDRAARGRAMHCLRDKKRWDYLLTYLPQCFVAAAMDGRIDGYVFYDFQESSHSASSPFGSASRSTLRVVEMFTETPEALSALRIHLASRSEADTFEFAAPADILVQNGFSVPVDAPASLMTRVVDWHGLLEALTPNWHGFDGELGLVLIDPLTSDKQICAIVHGAGSGKPQAVAVEGTELDARCRDVVVGDILTWSAVTVGHSGAREAFGAGRLKASTPTAAEQADRLFPARRPFLPTADHF